MIDVFELGRSAISFTPDEGISKKVRPSNPP